MNIHRIISWDYFFGFSWVNVHRIFLIFCRWFKNGRKSRGDVSAQHPPSSRRVRGGVGSLPALGSRARVSVSALARHPAPAPHAPATRRPRGPAQPRNPRRPASRDLPPRARVRSACHLRFLRSVRAVDERGMGTTSSRPAPQHYPVPPVRSKETRARPRPNPREANPAAPALRSPANKKKDTHRRALSKKTWL